MSTDKAIVIGAILIALASWIQGEETRKEERCVALWHSLSSTGAMVRIAQVAAQPNKGTIPEGLAALERFMGISFQECARSKSPVY